MSKIIWAFLFVSLLGIGERTKVVRALPTPRGSSTIQYKLLGSLSDQIKYLNQTVTSIKSQMSSLGIVDHSSGGLAAGFSDDDGPVHQFEMKDCVKLLASLQKGEDLIIKGIQLWSDVSNALDKPCSDGSSTFHCLIENVENMGSVYWKMGVDVFGFMNDVTNLPHDLIKQFTSCTSIGKTTTTKSPK